jgi:SOS-response transcriptional repressor LexA
LPSKRFPATIPAVGRRRENELFVLSKEQGAVVARNVVRALEEPPKKTQLWLAEKSGIPQPKISDLISSDGARLWGWSQVQGVAEALDRSVRDLWPDAPFGEEAEDVRHVPLVGSITMGAPIVAEANIERQVAVPRTLAPAKAELFCLRAFGDSMEPGFLDGDVVVIQRYLEPRHGDVVAARTRNQESALRRLLIADDTRLLAADNTRYKPVDATQAEIDGVAVGLLRKLRGGGLISVPRRR